MFLCKGAGRRKYFYPLSLCIVSADMCFCQEGTWMSESYLQVTVAVNKRVAGKTFLKKVFCCLKEDCLPL